MILIQIFCWFFEKNGSTNREKERWKERNKKIKGKRWETKRERERETKREGKENKRTREREHKKKR